MGKTRKKAGAAATAAAEDGEKEADAHGEEEAADVADAVAEDGEEKAAAHDDREEEAIDKTGAGVVATAEEKHGEGSTQGAGGDDDAPQSGDEAEGIEGQEGEGGASNKVNSPIATEPEKERESNDEANELSDMGASTQNSNSSVNQNTAGAAKPTTAEVGDIENFGDKDLSEDEVRYLLFLCITITSLATSLNV